jgi:hypothetical protein
MRVFVANYGTSAMIRFVDSETACGAGLSFDSRFIARVLIILSCDSHKRCSCQCSGPFRLWAKNLTGRLDFSRSRVSKQPLLFSAEL